MHILGFLPKSLTFGANDIQGVDFEPYLAPAIDDVTKWLRANLANGPMVVLKLAKRHGIVHLIVQCPAAAWNCDGWEWGLALAGPVAS